MAFTDYTLPQNAYTTFDALTLKQLLINRLNQNSTFSDQNFEASNLNSVLDIVATMYHVLLFQLNQTASETLFDTSTVYENMNRIVKLLGYKPLGPQTSLLTFQLSATESLTPGSYTIPRYSYTTINSINYSFRNDVVFEKLSAVANIDSISQNVLLYQGTYQEYPAISLNGEDFESVELNFTTNDNRFVADNTIDVYVLEYDNLIRQYTEIDSLFNASPYDRVFERRYNERGNFEIKFGNGASGRKMVRSEQLYLYYLLSDGKRGIVGKNVLRNKSPVIFNSLQFQNIYKTVGTANTLTPAQTLTLKMNNSTGSTSIDDAETVDEIRTLAPKLFVAQNRAVTVTDYEAFIEKNFSNIILSNAVVANDAYIEQFLAYFYNVQTRPNDDERVLLNQTQFSSSCNFNNVYVFAVPRTNTILDETQPTYLNTAQKQLLVNELNKISMISQEVVPQDPIYVAASLGLAELGEIVTPLVKDVTQLIIKRKTTSQVSRERIKQDVFNVIQQFFAPENQKLGQVVNLLQLTNDILSIDGVDSFYTKRIDGDSQIAGLSFVLWNPLYEKDITVSSQNVALPFYKFPFYYQISQLINKIVVE